MAPANFQLVMQSGPTPGKNYPLDKNEIFIGRDINNDIVISDAEISRKHSRLILGEGSYVIEDLGSTNGTFVNGQRLLGPHSLTAGELIMLGENVGLSFETIGFDVEATVVGSGGASAAEKNGTSTVVESYGPAAAAPEPSSGKPFNPPPAVAMPASEYANQQIPTQRKGWSRWFFAGCGCLVVVACLLIIIVSLILVFMPDALETVLCWGVFKDITNSLLENLGSSYYCP